ncbi:MAG: hypothetical protein Q9177_002369 [Variospora cf. flavescens]
MNRMTAVFHTLYSANLPGDGLFFLSPSPASFLPLSGNIYFPALNYLATDLNVSLELISLTITAYLIFQGIVPFIVGDAADTIGRRPVYIAVFVVYLGANIGLALQNSYPALLVLRILQSSGSSGRTQRRVLVRFSAASLLKGPAGDGSSGSLKLLEGLLITEGYPAQWN